LVGFANRERNLEAVFIIVFSCLVFALLFFFIGANGLVLGNDPAVHLETAKYFLSTGSLPLSDILWLPPLYHLVLATFISFTGATTAGQQLVLIKAVTALMDWMLIFSVYLIAAKFFNKKTGLIAASLLLLSFPLYELNSWGGYTSILSLTFMTLLFVYLALPLKSAGNALVAFILAFSIVLTHQLAAFLLAFILPPFIIVVLAKSRGHYPRALIAAIVGGGVAFGIYYLRPLLPYIGDFISIVFFQLKTMIYQVPSVSSGAFIMYFGFIVFFAFAGIVLAFFELRKQRSLIFYLLLVLAFTVPLFFSQSYLLGFYLPFQWFVYYLLPALAVFAAVTFVFVVDLALQSFSNNKKGWKRVFLKIVSITIIAVLAASMLLHFQTLSTKMSEDTMFYSTSNTSAYQAGTWLSQNNVDPSLKLVVSQNPGHWFWVYSGLNVFAETDPIVQWNYNASCVLDMSYELQHPLTMTRVYEAKSNISDENYVSINDVWKRATFFPEELAFVSYRDQNGTLQKFKLSDLNRTIFMDEANYPKKISISYSSQDFRLTENIEMENNTYPVNYTWQLTAQRNDLSYPTIYLSEYFSPQMSFTKANVPGLLNWENPSSNPSYQVANNWAATDFYKENFTADNKIDILDEQNQAGVALKFLDLPDYGNVGSLSSGDIDAVRWQYSFFKISTNFTVSVSYQMLSFSMSSYPQLKDLKEMNTLFDLTVAEPFDVQYRNFADVIRDNYIGYIVYDVNRFDNKLLSSKWMQPIYSNDKYIILKISSNHPYANILENKNPSE
jgi:hypothetical protein